MPCSICCSKSTIYLKGFQFVRIFFSIHCFARSLRPVTTQLRPQWKLALKLVHTTRFFVCACVCEIKDTDDVLPARGALHGSCSFEFSSFHVAHASKSSLKAGSHDAICYIEVFCTQFKAITHELRNLKRTVCDKSYRDKPGSDGAICMMRFFCVIVLSSKQ